MIKGRIGKRSWRNDMGKEMDRKRREWMREVREEGKEREGKLEEI